MKEIPLHNLLIKPTVLWFHESNRMIFARFMFLSSFIILYVIECKLETHEFNWINNHRNNEKIKNPIKLFLFYYFIQW